MMSRHAAAVFDTSGELLAIAEDVGRHNAVDKLLGTLLMDDKLPASELGLIVSAFGTAPRMIGRSGSPLTWPTATSVPMWSGKWWP